MPEKPGRLIPPGFFAKNGIIMPAMIRKHRKKIYILAAVLMMAFIFWQSSLPADVSSMESNVIVEKLSVVLKADKEVLSFSVRKCAHFLEYLILGLPLALVFWDMRRLKLLLPWGTGTLYAVSDEIHQMFVPGRSCELRDILIDCAGAAAGVLLIWLLKRKREMKQKQLKNKLQ